jgi:acetaldehyde dehydrogenase
MNKKMKVAILGTGNIGTDLLVKVMQSKRLQCVMFIGRSKNSHGISIAKNLGVPTSIKSINEIKNNPSICDMVFDATTAKDHAETHWPLLKKLGKYVIDMTPSNVGKMVIPAIFNFAKISSKDKNFNMVSCGGQVSLPIIHAISSVQKDIKYIEVVSNIASLSAGAGTRSNIDEYIKATEDAVKKISLCSNAKVILNLNPAIPCIHMQTTISVEVENPDMVVIKNAVIDIVNVVQSYVAGYKIMVGPIYENGRIFIGIKVSGKGDYLPEYAGNLDIINCAAIAVAEALSLKTKTL